MNIFVTGASGFAGSYLVDVLVKDKGNNIYATTQQAKLASFDNLEWHQCDLLDGETVKRLIGSIKPEQIYHLAAYSSPGDSFKEPLKAVNETAAIQINLFEACLLANITPRVLIVSSGQIYSKGGKLPLDEESAIDCNSPYAVAKLTQENLAQYYSKRDFNIIIARPFNHIGPRQALGFIVSDLANQIALAETQPELSKVKVGNLSSKRDFTDVRDIVLAYIQLMHKGKSAEVYNICSGKSVSGEEILSRLVSMSKCKIRVEVDPEKMRPSDIPDLYGDHSKLTNTTGWNPSIKLEQTLAETLDYWRANVSKTS